MQVPLDVVGMVQAACANTIVPAPQADRRSNDFDAGGCAPRHTPATQCPMTS